MTDQPVEVPDEEPVADSNLEVEKPVDIPGSEPKATVNDLQGALNNLEIAIQQTQAQDPSPDLHLIREAQADIHRILGDLHDSVSAPTSSDTAPTMSAPSTLGTAPIQPDQVAVNPNVTVPVVNQEDAAPEESPEEDSPPTEVGEVTEDTPATPLMAGEPVVVEPVETKPESPSETPPAQS